MTKNCWGHFERRRPHVTSCTVLCSVFSSCFVGCCYVALIPFALHHERHPVYINIAIATEKVFPTKMLQGPSPACGKYL